MCVSPQDLGCGGGGVGGLELWVLMATEPSRLDVITANGNHSQTKRRDVTDRCEHLPARRGGGGRRACRDEKRVVKRAEICEARVVKRQDWCATRHLMCTMRVGVHQSEDRDAQRVPQLPHHQPAVHVRDAFALSHKRHRDFRLTVASLFFFFFFSQETVF